MAEENAPVNMSQSSWLNKSRFILLFDKDLGSEVSFFDFDVAQEVPVSDRDIPFTCDSGSRLPDLAGLFYGDVTLWWVIAERNDIDNPVEQVHRGLVLIIPDPDVIRRNLVL